MENDLYIEHGFKNRTDYIQYLAGLYHLSVEQVWTFANHLGEKQDFHALVRVLEMDKGKP